MSVHTAGRLVVKAMNEYYADLNTPDGRTLASSSLPIARRLAACWNACENVPTEQVEELASISGVPGLWLCLEELRANNRTFRAERDSARTELDVMREAHTNAASERDVLRDQLAAARAERIILEKRIAAQREEIGRLHAKIGAQQDEAAQKYANGCERDEVLAAGYMKLQNNLASAQADSRAIEANYEAALALLERVRQSYSNIMDDEQDPLLFDIRKFLGPKP